MKNNIIKILMKFNNNKNINHKYHLFKSIQNIEDLKKLQNIFLKDLIKHSNEKNEYYNRLFNQTDLFNKNELKLSKFHNLPLLNKKIILENKKKIISKDYQQNGYYYNTSGGSTGIPLNFIQDKDYKESGKASEKYYYEEIIGIKEPFKKIILWGAPLDISKGTNGIKTRIINRISNTKFLDSFKMTEEDMEKYIKTINIFKPDLIRGYASSLYELCNYADKKGIFIYRPKAVISSADNLGYEMREKIESTLGTKVYNFYGSREVNHLAGECDKGLMHIFAFRNLIEIVNSDNQNVSIGEEGKVVVTNFFNYSMPFIRYEIGDMAILGPTKCKCGNPLPTLKNITGRVVERIILKDGTIISPLLFTQIFRLFHRSIFQFQCIQEDYEKFKILIVLKNKDMKIDNIFNNLEHKIKSVIGKNCEIIWDFVDEIPKTKNGKYITVKSEVTNY